MGLGAAGLMDRNPSNTEPSRMAIKHRDNLRALEEAFANLDALPPPMRRAERNLYVTYVARVLDAGRRAVEGLGDGPPSKPGGKGEG